MYFLYLPQLDEWWMLVLKNGLRSTQVRGGRALV